MTNARQRLGKMGEAMAARHLEDLGYQIRERNWRCARGEIDLVAEAGEVLVFVEVKTRRGSGYGSPEEGVTPRKAKRLIELGQQYVYGHDLDDVEWRIDLVAVELDQAGKLLRCEHIPNAVLGW